MAGYGHIMIFWYIIPSTEGTQLGSDQNSFIVMHFHKTGCFVMREFDHKMVALETSESIMKNKPKKKANKNHQTEPSNRYEGSEVLFPPPPPPPDSIKNLPKTEREALTSMLMSYYMSGFHTGYYLGMKQNNSKD
ncbi:hypothetical protein ACI65C_000681 [Semiaphis heraclei]